MGEEGVAEREVGQAGVGEPGVVAAELQITVGTNVDVIEGNAVQLEREGDVYGGGAVVAVVAYVGGALDQSRTRARRVGVGIAGEGERVGLLEGAHTARLLRVAARVVGPRCQDPRVAA